MIRDGYLCESGGCGGVGCPCEWREEFRQEFGDAAGELDTSGEGAATR